MSIAGTAYKPFCEYEYGATLGKMALKLKVVNQQFEKANLQEVLLRNVFQIVLTLVGLVTTVIFFNSPEFQEITGFMEYSTKLNANQGSMWVNWVVYILYIVDVIYLLSDKQKRSLHDRIGNTYVVQQEL